MSRANRGAGCPPTKFLPAARFPAGFRNQKPRHLHSVNAFRQRADRQGRRDCDHYGQGVDTRDSAEMVRAWNILKDWNVKMEEEGKPHMLIPMNDVQKRVT